MISSSYPFILQNGTTADASQVMADFYQIQSDVNSGAAASGTNSDITSLSGLTTPLTVAQGGTGTTSSTGTGSLVLATGPSVTGLITDSLTASSNVNIAGDLSVGGTSTLTGPLIVGDVISCASMASFVTQANDHGVRIAQPADNSSAILQFTNNAQNTSIADILCDGSGNMTLLATTVLAPTPSGGDNSTKVATTAFVRSAVLPAAGAVGSTALAYYNNGMSAAASPWVEGTNYSAAAIQLQTPFGGFSNFPYSTGTWKCIGNAACSVGGWGGFNNFFVTIFQRVA